MGLPTNLVLILISLWPVVNSVDSMHRSPIIKGGSLSIFNLILHPILNLRDRPIAGIHQPCGAGQSCFVLFICAFFCKVHFCQKLPGLSWKHHKLVLIAPAAPIPCI